MRPSALILIVALVLTTSQAFAEFYRWTDKNGNESFSNDPKQAPPEYRDSLERMDTGSARVGIGQKTETPAVTGAPHREGNHRDKNGRGEEYWRKRSDKLRKEISAVRAELAVIKKQESDEKEHPAKLSHRKSRSNASRDKKKAQLEKKLAKLKQELDVDLPDEARKADAYPGWIRE